MRYFVIGEDGELYGPADITTLNDWIAQGRLAPTTMIQEEFGGARFAASLLAGLSFSPNYVRPGTGRDPGDQEFKMAWIMGVAGLLCCSLCGPIGLAYAINAKKKGHPNATAPIIFCAIISVISIIWTIFYFKMGGVDGMMRALKNLQ